jgi:hypothetical protein
MNCECELAGFCSRHIGTSAEYKGKALYAKCQDQDQSYKQMWDNRADIAHAKYLQKPMSDFELFKYNNTYIKYHKNIDVHNLFYGQTSHYNPSIIRFQKKTIMAWRSNQHQSKLKIASLNNNWKAEFVKELKIDKISVEDPKLFIFQKELYISYHVLDEYGFNQHYGKLNENLDIVEEYQIQYAEGGIYTKNWAFFQHKDELFALVSVRPHVVLKIRDGIVESTIEFPNDLCGDNLMCGAPPVLYENDYYVFYNKRENNKSVIGVYTFDDSFKPKEYIDAAILEDKLQVVGKNTYDSLFCSGAFHKRDQWFISYGYNSNWCNLIVLGSQNIRSNLINVIDCGTPVGLPPTNKKSRGFGDTLAKGLEAVGITKERYSKTKQMITGKKSKAGCTPCSKRQELLNKLFPYKQEESEKDRQERRRLKREKANKQRKGEQESPESPLL